MAFVGKQYEAARRLNVAQKRYLFCLLRDVFWYKTRTMQFIYAKLKVVAILQILPSQRFSHKLLKQSTSTGLLRALF